MIKVKFLRPQAGFAAGALWHTDKIGVAKTLISLGACVEVKDDEPKLDSKEDIKPKRTRRKSTGSKRSSKN